MKIWLACAAATLLCATSASAAPAAMREGLWEITTSTEMPGMPMPSQKIQQCFTKADTENPKSTVPARDESDCKIADQKQNGNSFSMTMKCNGGDMVMKSEITYQGDSYNGKTVMEMKEDGEAMTMTTKIAAKRIGDCKK